MPWPHLDVLPHPGGDALLLGSEGVGIDCRHLEAGVAHPLAEHVERNATADGVDAVAVAQTLG